MNVRGNNTEKPTHRRDKGMGVIEAVTILAGIAGLMTAAVVTSNSLRTSSAEAQTHATLRELRQALMSYQAEHKTLPSGPTERVITTLLQSASSRVFMQKLPISFADRNRPTVYDGYGHAIRYFGPEDKPTQGADFVSAGPDGRFGDPSHPSPLGIDDLRGVDFEVMP